MMAKGPKRRFILGVLMAACLLFCILCLNPEEVRKHFHGFIQDTSSFQVFQEYQKPMNNRTSDLKVPSETPVHPNPTKQEPTEDKALNVTQPTSKSTNVIVNPGPTEPAYIGDTYMSEDSVPLTNCLNSLHSKVSQTDFGDRFLKDIPVLQWAKHVSPEQYQRLRQYPGAHGWAVIDYNSLLESLSALNSSANRQMFDDWSSRGNQSGCIRCAVVGNGGILRGSKKGAEIDSHHYVFRTNGAVIQGFEKDVGSRTTHYTFSVNTLMNSLRSYAKVGYRRPPLSKETRYIFLPDHDRDYLMMKAAAMHVLVERGAEFNKNPTDIFGKDVSVEKLKMYHPDFIRYIRNRFIRSNTLKTKLKDIYRPSTGAVMLLAALHTCDQVSAYGFMTPDYNKYSDHYYDSSHHPVVFYANHDMRLEMTLWQQLHQAGLIRLYMHR
ncbi:alpha-N-acetylgalactosaminide alpha-2,6-sialyltransferase 2 isoform X2 [Cynoglossus semilaevis]|uniref:alpha-N-acetylgalactosaminide alpha-2,6-sialyltransferase 2 isoform X2 n=1 Tax=Cynoglossus semilaevis TaxID=244447 RepID=UPI0004975A4E|nr:alpha-N-acetylgalactosaminide alpha-2,6-sialyltransferase 2 isoform X2 [Cynoglossus semilaevis]